MTDQKKEARLFLVPRAKLSDFEKIHIVEGFNEGVRNDGRECKEFRAIALEVGVLPQVEGSARIQAGDVDITVGIRAELETIIDPDAYFAENKPKLRMDFNVEFSATADHRFIGKEPMDWPETVRSALEGAYSNDLALPSLTDLQLTRRLSWNIFADIEITGYDGNVVDFASIALKAALTDFKVPKMRVLSDTVDGTGVEIDGVEFPPDVEYIRLDTSHCPLLITVNLISDNFAVDVTEAEGYCVTSAICVGMILAPEKDGKPPNEDDHLITYTATVRRGTMELSTLRQLYKFATQSLLELNEKLQKFLERKSVGRL